MDTKERAKKAADARWHQSPLPKATHSGILTIGNQEISCDVLEDGRRVLRQRTMLRAIGKSNLGKYDYARGEALNLPAFLTANNLMPYLKPDFAEKGQLIIYRSPDGRKITGYEAPLLPEVCKIYVQAEADGVLADSQLKIAKVCKSMLCALATVGIVSLVDEVTGYVELRNRSELQRILENYIAEELRAWTKKFPNEFFKQVYRLHGWEYSKLQKYHPQCLGKIINKYIYEALPPGVLEELKQKNPPDENGNRRYRHHQFLTPDIGDDNLKKQITQVITLMKISDNMDTFKSMVEKLKEN